jgi:hypothetical protein
MAEWIARETFFNQRPLNCIRRPAPPTVAQGGGIRAKSGISPGNFAYKPRKRTLDKSS